ncbi:MAG: glycosyltransferase family 9 protein, partial [Sulfuritalea sp.]|nr:glycosyltransferase family 9 protein [Sulfuritalea sp.]
AVEKHRGERLIQETYLALLERMGVVGGCVDKEAFAVAGAEARVDAVLGLSREPMLIGIGVSSANRLKALGSVKIEAIAGQLLLAQPGARIVLVGSHEDSAQAALMVRALPHGSVITACGALSLAELPALLKRLALFVGVDSGITYMADAVGTPVVSVAGPCNMLETRPLGRAAVILQRDDLPCAPCAHIFNAPYTCRVGTRACVEEIPAGEIVTAALAMLRRHSDGKAQC